MSKVFNIIPLWIFIPVAWCGMCYLISIIGGWRAIAERCPRRHPPRGRRYYMCNAQIGWAGYGNCVNIVASDEGLDLSVFPLFRFGHKPIFIPWLEIRNPQVKRIFFFKYVRFEVGSPSVAKVELDQKYFLEMPKSFVPEGVELSRPVEKAEAIV